MIAKRIDREPENDNYGNLTNYIRDAKHARLPEYISDKQHAGEKVLYAWYAGCLADSYDLAIKEVSATQTLNTRSQKEKTYHLMLSFRPEDEEYLTQDIFKEMEQEFAQALGFEEYQRHCGVHKNTDNLHIHIAYNMIHPEKLTRHEPFRDFVALSRTCRAMEQKYGLAVDRGMEGMENPQKIQSQRARAMEAQSGQESFATYAQRHGQEWEAAAAKANTWEDFHGALASYGVEYVLRGNGAVIKNRHGGGACKASDAARSLSKVTLSKRFGDYIPHADKAQVPEKPEWQYHKLPLDQGTEKSALWQQFQQAMQERQETLATISHRQKFRLAMLQKVSRETRANSALLVISMRDRGRLARQSRFLELRKRKEILTEAVNAREALKKRVPFSNWTQFLQSQADQGDEMALTMLRQRSVPQKKVPQISHDWKWEQYQVQGKTTLSRQVKSQLISQLKVRELADREKAEGKAQLFANATTEVSKQGAVVVHLPCGELRDTGHAVYFRGDDQIQHAAEQFARQKWGPAMKLEKGAFVPIPPAVQKEKEKLKDKEKQKGHARGA